jgi:acetylornithine deacetylase
VPSLPPIQQTLGDLVAIDSVSARSNTEITRYLRDVVERIGCAVTEHRYLDDHGIVKVNLVAILGPAIDPPGGGGLAFSTHTDVAPYDPSWTDPLALVRKDGRLHGRGVCSAKGFAAAAIEAARSIDAANLEHPLALVFTADGEPGSRGARKLAERRAVTPSNVVVGEPTSNRPARAHKGQCVAEIEIDGREVHSAFPELGTSAIYRAAELIKGLQRLETELRADTDATFEPPYPSLNVGLIQGGRASNVVPRQCRVSVEWRPLPGVSAEKVKELIEAEVARVRETTGGLPIRLTMTRMEPAVTATAGSDLVRFFETKTGVEAGSVPFATELSSWISLGANGVIFGPGDIRDVRPDSEWVAETQLQRAADMLARVIEHFCFV